MTPADRLRIKLDAWADRLRHRVPEIVFVSGVGVVAVTIYYWLRP